MKNRIVYFFIFLLILLITSCGKKVEFNNYNYGKIDYYVSGIYLELESNSKADIDDNNPKIYFNFKDDKYYGYFNTSSGTATSAVAYNNVGHQEIKDGDLTIYYGNCNVSIKNEDIKNIKLYPIYLKNGKDYEINKDLYEKINLSSTTSYEFNVYYTINKQKMGIQIKLLFQ